MMYESRYLEVCEPEEATGNASNERLGVPGTSRALADARSPLCWPHTRRHQKWTASTSSFQASQDDSEEESSAESDDERLHRDGGWEHDETMASERGSTSQDPPRSRPEQASPAPKQVSEAEEDAVAEMTAAAFSERRSKMFDAEKAGPTRSGLRRIAVTVTKKLVQLAWVAISELSDNTIKLLSTAYGNFDRVVAVGWLIADAMGHSLIERASAHAIGLKARRIAGSVKTDTAAIQKAPKDKARKQGLSTDDPARLKLEREAVEVEASLLLETVEPCDAWIP
jgi:hypothetical protein